MGSAPKLLSGPGGNPYSRLAPLAREYIYDKRWPSLRAIQEQAIGAVFDGAGDILLAAGTASGKTEAAFFPTISLLLEARKSRAYRNDEGVEILYISPLKALINDQWGRLVSLLERGKIPLWRWHGDVPGNHKDAFIASPSGVLQITPESLEALLIRRPGDMKRLFHRLAFIIIDELHVFLGSDRGSQILCQIERIKTIAQCRPRKIGLSATLGNYPQAQRWLSPQGEAVLIREAEGKRRIRVRLDYFQGNLELYRWELYRQCRWSARGKCVVFANSRAEAEETAAMLRNAARERGEDDIFPIHHGSVAGSLRLEAEQELKERDGPLAAVATGSLELGIDIGDLEKVIQIGPPTGAASLAQRLGRSGRRKSGGNIYFSLLGKPLAGDYCAQDALDLMPWDLLKTIGILELYLEEGWVEEARPRSLPYSLLIHQTMSLIAAGGEISPPSLAKSLLSMPVFSCVSQEDYREILRKLMEEAYLRKTDRGKLALDIEGERVLGHYSFYATFPDETVYRVLHEGRELGTVNALPPKGSSLTLAGWSWLVKDIRLAQKEILVTPGEEGAWKVWQGREIEMHGRIPRAMRRILGEDRLYPYLSPKAREALSFARNLDARYGFTKRAIIRLEGSSLDNPRIKTQAAIVPWLGSRGLRTLMAILNHTSLKDRLGIHSIRRRNDFTLEAASTLPFEEFQSRFYQWTAEAPFPEEGDAQDSCCFGRIIDPAEIPLEAIPLTDKFDHLLPPDLLRKQYAAHRLDERELGEMRDHSR